MYVCLNKYFWNEMVYDILILLILMKICFFNFIFFVHGKGSHISSSLYANDPIFGLVYGNVPEGSYSYDAHQVIVWHYYWIYNLQVLFIMFIFFVNLESLKSILQLFHDYLQ